MAGVAVGVAVPLLGSNNAEMALLTIESGWALGSGVGLIVQLPWKIGRRTGWPSAPVR